MRPPQCDLCGHKFDPQDGGGLVRFGDYEPLPDGMTGHPDGVEWFCERHFDAAEALSEAPYADALRELRRVYGFKGWAPAWLATLRKRYWFPR